MGLKYSNGVIIMRSASVFASYTCPFKFAQVITANKPTSITADVPTEKYTRCLVVVVSNSQRPSGIYSFVFAIASFFVMGTEEGKPQNSFTDEELRVHELGVKNNLKQAEVKTLIDYYKRKDPHNQGLLPHQFKEAAGEFIASGVTIDPNVVYNIFNTAETGVSGRVTMREFILGYAILCRGTTENRLRYLFAIYGSSDHSDILTRDQLISSLKLMHRIVSEITDIPICTNDESDEKIRSVADNLITESSIPNSNCITYDDFIEKIKEDDVVMSWLEKLSAVAGEHLKYIEKLELDVVELNMEREGILSGSMPRPNLSQKMEWTPATVSDCQNSISIGRPLPIDRKRRIPMPRKQKLVRRDLRAQRIASESEISSINQTDDMDDAEINAAQPFLINYDQIQFGKILGRGACATVYQGTWMHIPVAVKVFNDGNGEAAGIEGLATADEEMRKAIVGDYVEEFWLLLQIRHPNCLLYMGICFEPVVCIVTELFSGGSVASFLHGPNARKFTPFKALEMISCVARGMYYLHASSPPILHRDLKASNILINRLVTHCVICDFGLSRQFVKEASGIDTRDRGGENGVIGTPYTMAPEIMEQKEYTPAADVYSFAIVMYEMFVGRFPFPHLKPIQLMFHVSEGKRPKFFESDKVPPTLRKLIESCWAHDPKNRPTFEDILKVLTSPKLTEEVDAAERSVHGANGIDDRMKYEKDVNELSKQLLDEAYIGRADQLLRLINRGANIDYCDYDRRTPLHVGKFLF